MNFITVVLFAVAGGLTFIASRLITTYGASDDVAQYVYPLLAMFSLWLSAFVEKRQKNKEIKENVDAQKRKWLKILKEVKESKSELLEKIIQAYNRERIHTNNFFSEKIEEAIRQELPYKNDLDKVQARMFALELRNKELVQESLDKNEHIEIILHSKSSLDRKISKFIRQLRGFHEEINRELKGTASKNTGIWKSIDDLAGKIFEEINRFDDYISQALIEEKENISPFNRKVSQQKAHDDFISKVGEVGEANAGNKKR